MLNDAQRQELARIIERGPIPAIHGVLRRRLIDLTNWIPHPDFRADLEPTAAGDGLPQVLGLAAPSRSQPACRGGL